MNTTLKETINHLEELPISEERKKVLSPFINYLQEKIEKEGTININFICTHNSRRSHLGQIWMQTLVNHFEFKNINCFSGGTEATALAKPVVKTLNNQGFEIEVLSKDDNPVYAIKPDENSLPIICFSKEYWHSYNPKNDFLAIMTCSQADEGCPFVAGAKKRIPITYEDPKNFDNTELQEEKYLERSLQIASELHYVLTQLKF